MSSLDVFDAIKTRDAWVDDLVVYVQGKPVGLLLPSVLVSVGQGDESYFYGPRGIGSFQIVDTDAAWAALISVGGVLFGTVSEVQRLRQMLLEDRTSRTVAYLCSVCSSCAETLLALDRVRASKVAVMGVGGIGSLTAMSLAGAGVSTLLLVDPDIVEGSNFNRQFFYQRKHIGIKKVDALAESIRERFSDVEVVCICKSASAETVEGMIEGVDAVVVSADEPLGLASEVFRVAREHAIHAVGCGYVHGHAGVQFFSAGSDTQETDNREELRQWSRAPHSVMPSFGPTNIELAGVASSLALLSLAGLSAVSNLQMEARWDTTQFPREWKAE
jgi:hypothetical protein